MTPAQRSTTATQPARQLVPVAQPIAEAARQGSGWQLPPRQTWPLGQCAGQPIAPAPPCPAAPVPPPPIDPTPLVLPDPVAELPPVPSFGLPVEPAAPASCPSGAKDCEARKSHPSASNANQATTEPATSDERRTDTIVISNLIGTVARRMSEISWRQTTTSAQIGAVVSPSGMPRADVAWVADP